MPIIYWNLVLWGHFVWISTHLDNFSINRILNWKKVSFSKPPPTPFRQSPPKQQGSWNHTFLRGKDKQTNVVLKRLPERRQRKTETRQSTVFYTMFTGLFLIAMEIMTELKINITVITTYFTVNVFKLILFRITFLEK